MTKTHVDYVLEAFEEFIQKNDPRGGKVLDVGCRGSYLSEYFEKAGFEWFGLDNTMCVDDRIVINDMSNMEDIDDDSFDLVFACHSFEHCERPVDALREFFRVLKEGGWLFLATPNVCEKQILKGDDDHIFVLNSMQMSKLLYYSGFDLEGKSYLQCDGIEKEQDFNVISVAKKITVKEEENES